MRIIRHFSTFLWGVLFAIGGQDFLSFSSSSDRDPFIVFEVLFVIATITIFTGILFWNICKAWRNK